MKEGITIESLGLRNKNGFTIIFEYDSVNNEFIIDADKSELGECPVKELEEIIKALHEITDSWKK